MIRSSESIAGSGRLAGFGRRGFADIRDRRRRAFAQVTDGGLLEPWRQTRCWSVLWKHARFPAEFGVTTDARAIVI